ncbi:MAG TPA: hypothetical protein VGI39_11130 [Polyangiaceae bacterium]|jgi:hypothetical protein
MRAYHAIAALAFLVACSSSTLESGGDASSNDAGEDAPSSPPDQDATFPTDTGMDTSLPPPGTDGAAGDSGQDSTVTEGGEDASGPDGAEEATSDAPPDAGSPDAPEAASPFDAGEDAPDSTADAAHDAAAVDASGDAAPSEAGSGDAGAPDAGDEGKLSWKSLSAGLFGFCGLTTDGTAYCWGSDLFNPAATHPQAVATGGAKFDALSFRAIGTSAYLCGLDGGALSCWGNAYGTSTQTSPTPVQSSTTFAKVSVGFSQTCALTTAGALFCWGSSPYGALGASTNAVPGSYADVSSSQDLVCTLDMSGNAQCSGTNASIVGAPPSGPFTKIDADFEMACGIDTGSKLHCWGSATDCSLPGGPIPGNDPLVDVVNRCYASCALAASGTVYCWGRNDNGFLGLGTTDNMVHPLPTAVPGLPPMASIAASTYSVCGLSRTGERWCWGRDRSGELGDGFSGAAIPPQYSEDMGATPESCGPQGGTRDAGVADAGVGDGSAPDGAACVPPRTAPPPTSCGAKIGDPCCACGVCAGANLTCIDGLCAPSCGYPGLACCNGTTCAFGSCFGGYCALDAIPLPPATQGALLVGGPGFPCEGTTQTCTQSSCVSLASSPSPYCEITSGPACMPLGTPGCATDFDCCTAGADGSGVCAPVIGSSTKRCCLPSTGPVSPNGPWTCIADEECCDGVCSNGHCVGNAAGTPCASGAECADTPHVCDSCTQTCQ